MTKQNNSKLFSHLNKTKKRLFKWPSGLEQRSVMYNRIGPSPYCYDINCHVVPLSIVAVSNYQIKFSFFHHYRATRLLEVLIHFARRWQREISVDIFFLFKISIQLGSSNAHLSSSDNVVLYLNWRNEEIFRRILTPHNFFVRSGV